MALEQRTAILVSMRIAEKTTKRYETGAKAFARFAVFYRFLPILPATDKALAAFVSFQSQSCTHDTQIGYLSHIRDKIYEMVNNSSHSHALARKICTCWNLPRLRHTEA